MPKMFGTDGVRGVANTVLTPELALQLGRAAAYVLDAASAAKPKRVLVGTDTRRSADMLEAALAAGLCSVGADVYRAGVVPSPAMAHLVRQYKMDAGVMLSASHNPMPDNGIKIFDKDGYKLSDALEDKIEAFYGPRSAEIPRPTGAAVGVCHPAVTVREDYVDFLVGTLSQAQPFAGMRVALDCANGAVHKVAPMAFGRLGAEVSVIHHDPNGVNINEGCGSTHLASLQAFTVAQRANIGLAFDGDGDRVLAVDENGAEVDGDAIMAICGLALAQKGRLKNNAIVATVMSNLGLRLMCQKEGLALLETAVGDRYVLEAMRAGGYNLGGEQSGHIIFLDHNTTGDGILTGLQLLAVLCETGKPLSQLRTVLQKMPQVLVNAKVADIHKYSYMENAKVADTIAQLTEKMAGEGRVLVRPSGTEPLVRVMIEGRDPQLIKQWAEALAKLLEETFAG